MENLGYYNGKYDLIENMTIPMNDRVCYFGDGVYDATYSRNHIIFALDEHIDRFFNSAGLLRIKIPYTKDELKEILTEMVKKVDSGEQFVYWQVTRGTGMRNHIFPGDEVKANLWIVLKPLEVKDMSQKLKLITLEDTRFLHCNIKTLNLLPSVIAAQKAEEAGCQEAVFHRGDRVTECAHSNVSIIKDGIFRTAPADNLILPGIARAHIIKMCKKFNIPVNETAFTVKDLMNADEVIVTSSGQFCMTAAEIDGKPVGGKAPEIVKKLQDALLEEYLEETNVEQGAIL
ncbi:MAG: D-amino acid aminotransferase [Clostridium sp.]|jgi:D-alanine transaminase|uniref:D-amino acid aminotransferase n=1 Tax=Clostridium sp. TaxID=1506 RepID=UPI0025C1D822|nr:D-amino acid aminotransferase [Clostridium sp.]MCH3963512.1 D-amino acid aminotransferase [Clostridium sp.]MCI1714653.1 D-amino acid aminotransferase [Clostridium sp.]MCI1799158.1 D-amino acid aminotransferase [Clostridium sp.]MCI1812836.1 D-amino acid aminotransferase [Clostridium sp.]MCI1869726.1 D-amino acid aminotransferase [Clostridium sp.]